MNQNQNQPSLEQYLNNYWGQHDNEKSYIDKVLNRKDSERLRVLHIKKELTSEEVLEILNIMSGTNIKLLNYNEWDRYLLSKCFTWISDFAGLCNPILNWNESVKKDLKNIEKTYFKNNYSDVVTDLKWKEFLKDPPEEWITKKELVDSTESIKNICINYFKFLVNVYLNMSNSTLSLEGVGFDTLTKNKYDYQYQDGNHMFTQPKSNFSMLFRR